MGDKDVNEIEEIVNDKQEQEDIEQTNYLAVGISLGVVFGLIFNNLAIGLALGICFGTTYKGKKNK